MDLTGDLTGTRPGLTGIPFDAGRHGSPDGAASTRSYRACLDEMITGAIISFHKAATLRLIYYYYDYGYDDDDDDFG
eukprot:CAMPEP_0119357762 /NCGR_PEP_ID=MMETSP1334-20130426/6095_1 /TAXON_ID=127549 /ORGANISM="Calcidiscus leptoporus, Strain RCC1130" /LENGTH=76 /DNA_ID=CAMNT_0007372081 /DNA_START=188 /DNA_END=414 /DNA_ORIENTATION=-